MEGDDVRVLRSVCGSAASSAAGASSLGQLIDVMVVIDSAGAAGATETQGPFSAS